MHAVDILVAFFVQRHDALDANGPLHHLLVVQTGLDFEPVVEVAVFVEFGQSVDELAYLLGEPVARTEVALVLVVLVLGERLPVGLGDALAAAVVPLAAVVAEDAVLVVLAQQVAVRAVLALVAQPVAAVADAVRLGEAGQVGLRGLELLAAAVPALQAVRARDAQLLDALVLQLLRHRDGLLVLVEVQRLELLDLRALLADDLLLVHAVEVEGVRAAAAAHPLDAQVGFGAVDEGEVVLVGALRLHERLQAVRAARAGTAFPLHRQRRVVALVGLEQPRQLPLLLQRGQVRAGAAGQARRHAVFVQVLGLRAAEAAHVRGLVDRLHARLAPLALDGFLPLHLLDVVLEDAADGLGLRLAGLEQQLLVVRVVAVELVRPYFGRVDRDVAFLQLVPVADLVRVDQEDHGFFLRVVAAEVVQDLVLVRPLEFGAEEREELDAGRGQGHRP